jgi:hypothetical protein
MRSPTESNSIEMLNPQHAVRPCAVRWRPGAHARPALTARLRIFACALRRLALLARGRRVSPVRGRGVRSRAVCVCAVRRALGADIYIPHNRARSSRLTRQSRTRHGVCSPPSASVLTLWHSDAISQMVCAVRFVMDGHVRAPAAAGTPQQHGLHPQLCLQYRGAPPAHVHSYGTHRCEVACCAMLRLWTKRCFAHSQVVVFGTIAPI